MNKTLILTVCLCGSINLFAQAQSGLLEKYRTMSLQYNHDLKAAEKNIRASMELERSARTGQKPKVDAGANFQYTGNPMELALDIPALGAPTSFQGKDTKYGATVSLLQPIYTGGRILETIRTAQLHQSLAVSQSETIFSGVCYQTDIQYWSTVAKNEIVKVAEDFRNSISSLASTIKERTDVGLVDPQDLLMAEVKLNEAEYQLLQAKNNFETGRMAFNSLIGLELQAATEIDTTIPKIGTADTLLSSGGTIRPEIKMAQDRIKIEESSSKLNDSQYKPQLFLGADGSYSSPGYNFRPDLDPNYAFYAKLSVPVFEWGKRRSDKKAYANKIDMANDNLNKIQDNVKLEIETARISLARAIERVGLSESSLSKAFENEQKAIERYNEGKVSIVEVIEAQTYRQTAQINFVQAKAASQGYYSELIKALNLYN